MDKKMDKKIEKFKSDYDVIKARVKELKKTLKVIHKDIKPIAKMAYKLFECGDKTMYNKDKNRVITPKFNGLEYIMDDLSAWMGLDNDIQYVIENTIF